ncbi:FUS3-complementing gene 1 [Striga asiatica]|uniref:FUS3-complementing gene 1 n=1 Tax=Striga asiatica TaxID=4170 RepID=A0A5A7R730_STRAF|nr:FUS3-complementing gene 1 [Striga asiatica]
MGVGIIMLYNTRPLSGRIHHREFDSGAKASSFRDADSGPKASSFRDADSGPKASSFRDADSGPKASSSIDVADCGPSACFRGTFPELLSPMDSAIPRRLDTFSGCKVEVEIDDVRAVALGKPAVKERVGRYAECLSVDPTRPDALVGLDQVSNLVGHDLGGRTCVNCRLAHAQATLKHTSLAG